MAKDDHTITPESVEKGRAYAWQYFYIHAEQRLKTFHFFLVFSALVIGAILTLAKLEDSYVLVAFFSYLFSFLTFVFWKLDVRNRDMIKHAEETLMVLERHFPDTEEGESLRLFIREADKTKCKKRFPQTNLWEAHMSYSNCFNSIFAVLGFGGFAFGTSMWILKLL